ncbi:heme-thiolate peroxidase [Candolleomyces aberdarensis]|uniref:Heme-thiolate peroxidase n=1 Tax=Candolleomyces aberdarensis TaxID=2316362 RepID=A0A4Q2D8K1_9AGAR|nr:heme-thiolate peroxidase [Candolleomyces aberdarensis]
MLSKPLALLLLWSTFGATLSFAFPSLSGVADGFQDLSARWGKDKPNHDVRLVQNPPTPPGPPRYTGTKLVNDRQHPWKPVKAGDIRGPCPALNTLANHGYIPRNGVASPSEIVNAVQEGLNSNNNIGLKTRRTGPSPPPPAEAGGLNVHGTFEGDASLTRGDASFGDNHNFNQTLFNKFTDFSNRYGGGFYDITVAGELRYSLIQDSISTNPNFTLKNIGYIVAYSISALPINFFVDGRRTDGKLSIPDARSFFKYGKFPRDFYRAAQPVANEGTDKVFLAHPVMPGGNADGKVNNYVLDPTSADFNNVCRAYESVVAQVQELYPNPTGLLRKNLIKNLQYLYIGAQDYDSLNLVVPFDLLSSLDTV